jgi:putative molybdopterin biosynthesis protein
VAVNVKSGAADAGLGIYAAAKALDLDFIPVTRERYDLVTPVEFLEQENITLLLELARSDRYRKRVVELGGYDPSQSGTVLGTYS